MRGYLLAAAICAAGPGWAEEVKITMAGAAYAPEMISAKVGDSIRFINDDGADHNVFVPTAAFAADLGKQEPGDEAIFVLRKAGRFEVECVFHDFMITTVEVQE